MGCFDRLVYCFISLISLLTVEETAVRKCPKRASYVPPTLTCYGDIVCLKRSHFSGDCYITVKPAHIQLQADYLTTVVHNVIVGKYCSAGLLKVVELIVSFGIFSVFCEWVGLFLCYFFL